MTFNWLNINKMKFQQKVTKEIKTMIEPRYKIWDVVYWRNEVDTIYISAIEAIKISEWYITYWIKVEWTAYRVSEKSIRQCK